MTDNIPEPDLQDVLNHFRQKCADLELVVARQDSVIRQLLARLADDVEG